MEPPTVFLVAALLVLLSFPSTNAQPGILSPTPAPAPAPDYVNLTDLLTVAGPFHTFLNYLEQTQVIRTFQNQANNTDEGITIFVPKDQAFSSLKKPTLSNLTMDELKSLLLFHSLPHYYSLAEFNNLSKVGPVSTMAGGQYTMNFTDIMGTVHVSSGWANSKISSSVHSTDPVALYQVDKVLLPEAIFGLPPPPSPAPAPAPEIAPTADSPTADLPEKGFSPKASTTPSHSPVRVNFGVLNYFGLAICGCLVMHF
ncbi:fasciclin-like arabinogalactan protein 7 isoform X2 [Aristolochia californica]